MDALTALHERVSVPRLGGEPPGEEVLKNMFKAALRAPDHAQLRPWRFLVVRGEARFALGELFAKALLHGNPDANEQMVEKAKGKPLRAPLMIIVVASIREHPKVPEIEQVLSAGAAAQNMLIAAHAQGVGAMWRTGSMAYDTIVKKGLSLAPNEKIVGYLYVGEAQGNTKTFSPLDMSDFVTEWPNL